MLYHKFYLIDSSVSYNDKWLEIIRSEVVSIEPPLYFDDELLIYMQDAFQWFRPLRLNKQNLPGFEMSGISIITDSESRKLESILRAWRGIFSYAPEEGDFILTGDSVSTSIVIEGDDQEEGNIEDDQEMDDILSKYPVLDDEQYNHVLYNDLIDGTYAKMVYTKPYILEKLDTLINFSVKVSNGGCYILHSGV